MAQPQQQAAPWRAAAHFQHAAAAGVGAPHQHQHQQHPGTALGAGCRHPPGKLLLGHIQTLQQQQQRPGWTLQSGTSGAARAGAATSAPSSAPGSAGLRSSSRAAFNEVSCLASAHSPADPRAAEAASSAGGKQPVPSFNLPQQQLDSSLELHNQQQQQQELVPFWKGSEPAAQQWDTHAPQHHHHHHHHHHHQQPRHPGARHHGGSGQFASATISGSSKGGGSSSGSGSDSPTAGLRAVGRAVFNGEACKLLGFVGAQLLMHLATLQRGMHQLQQQQHGADGEHPEQQQQQHGPFAGWRIRMPWQRQDAAGGRGDAGTGHGAGARGGTAWQAGDAAKQWVVRGVAAERSMDLREALACYTNAVTLEPANREYLCRLAKQWSDLTYEEGATVEQIQEVNAKAIEYAERVMAMAPKAADGYMASCVSRGRLALFSDNKTKVRLAKEAQEAARTAVQLEPSNDLAHHLMGRWHFEMAQINFVLRQLIRLVYGASLAPGTFEEALQEFQTAATLNPNKLIHRVELGRTHLRLGHKRDAYEHLTASMALDVEDINAKLQKEDAELLLAKLRAELKGRTELPASWGTFAGPGIVCVEDVTDSSSSSSSSSVAGSAAGSTDGSGRDGSAP